MKRSQLRQIIREEINKQRLHETIQLKESEGEMIEERIIEIMEDIREDMGLTPDDLEELIKETDDSDIKSKAQKVLSIWKKQCRPLLTKFSKSYDKFTDESIKLGEELEW